MHKYILTGAPGAGKTTLLRQLEIEGYPVVEEAATDIIYLEQAQKIAEPWQMPQFIETVTHLQILRRQFYTQAAQHQFFDRSPFCTLALALYLNAPVPQNLLNEIESIKALQFFHETVFFIENLGTITQTEARKISFDEALRFEKVHREVYLQHGFTLLDIPKDHLSIRVNKILHFIA